MSLFPATFLRKSGISVLILTYLFTLSIPLFSQRYTYIGGGINLGASSQNSKFGDFNVTSSYVINDGGYDVTIRQEINRILSIETGLSSHIYSQEFILQGNYIYLGGYFSHRIPLKFEFEVDLIEDRIKGYASLGTHFCLASRWYARGETTQYLDEGTLTRTSIYNSDKIFFTMYNVGTGWRFRIVDQLLIELEFGYTFRTKDLISHNITLIDQAGVSNFIYNDKANYGYIQFGISYPVQRIIQGLRWVIEQVDY